MSDKLDLKTPDMVNINIERIAALFPHCITETNVETPHGTSLQRQIDFDLLRQELSGEIVEGPKERYRLEWPGKREAIVTANMPTTNTLRPVREDSVNFDTTENLYIEGDNLEVLKLLQESYLGKIKMIYIDPPYNTGNDFVYRDNFAQDSDAYKADSGMTDELGNRLVANPETAGRYHSDWLTMMYPRLKLARNLLTDDGVIFISIDDNEVHNLRKMCDEVFGEINFITDVVWEKRFTRNNDAKLFSSVIDHTILYRKSDAISIIREPRTEKANSIYSNPDNDPRGPWTSVSYVSQRTKEQRPNLSYEMINPFNGQTIIHEVNAWKYSKEQYEIHSKENRLHWGKTGENSYPRLKRFLSELKDGMVPVNLWGYKEVGTLDEGTKDVDGLIGKDIFDYPKPITLIKKMLQVSGSKENDIILDFFSGSATTAHAVMQLNAEDGGNRKFIMVQLPEQTDEKSEAYKAGYKNICEIGKERIRRAGAKLTPSNSPEGGEQATLFDGTADAGSAQLLPSGEAGRGLDVGFRVYRLDTSNMQDVYYRPQDYKQDMMTELFANHIKPDRTADDLVAQVMLDWGLPLSLPIEQTTIAGKTVYKVAGNALYCCFDEGIDEEFVKALITRPLPKSLSQGEGLKEALPLRIVFHDYAFANDTAKENVRQLLKQLSGETEMRVV